MLFKDLKAGYTLFIFDREKVSFTPAKVLEVTPPHFDSHFGGTTEMVVDVTIEGFPKSYTFKESTNVGYLTNLVISTEREIALREVEALRTQSEKAWENRESYKETAEKCSHILSEFNPLFKERKETEERFTRLESSVGELKDMIQSLSKDLKK